MQSELLVHDVCTSTLRRLKTSKSEIRNIGKIEFTSSFSTFAFTQTLEFLSIAHNNKVTRYPPLLRAILVILAHLTGSKMAASQNEVASSTGHVPRHLKDMVGGMKE
jgi:hypothetical protein